MWINTRKDAMPRRAGVTKRLANHGFAGANTRNMSNRRRKFSFFNQYSRAGYHIPMARQRRTQQYIEKFTQEVDRSREQMKLAEGRGAGGDKSREREGKGKGGSENEDCGEGGRRSTRTTPPLPTTEDVIFRSDSGHPRRTPPSNRRHGPIPSFSPTSLMPTHPSCPTSYS